MTSILSLKVKVRAGDFPDVPAVEGPPYSEGNVSSIPGQGTKIPYGSKLTATELERHN